MSEPTGKQGSASGGADDDHDVTLLRRIAVERDRTALTELYQRYFQTLQRFIYRITNDIDQAQEGINDVMLVVWNKAGTFSGRSKASTWIMGIAYRKGLKLSQRASRWTFRFKSADWHETIEPIAGSPGHTETLILQDLVGRALGRLSPKHRAVVELTYVHGFSYEEIAEIVDCPVNTVKTRMFHARAHLRELVPALGRDDIER